MADGRQSSAFRRIVRIALVVAFVVVVLGAFVRLSDAGLGCPDWPGCYGQLGVPTSSSEVRWANEVFPDRPLETHKAFKEMVHRYFAGGLGLLILLLAIIAVRERGRPDQPTVLPVMLVVLVVLQALLGMWTVTLQLKPVVVLAHLLGGLATLSLIWRLFLTGSPWARTGRFDGLARYRGLAYLGIAILVCQIALGGWTSANYAALACPDFPTCQSVWWPRMDFSEAFVLWRGLGIDYEFGVLDNPARTAIHVTHRIGAIVTAVYLLALASSILLKTRERSVRTVAAAVLGLTLLQVALGISNVVFALPLGVAVAHNATAALMLLAMVALAYTLTPARVPATRRFAGTAIREKGIEDVST